MNQTHTPLCDTLTNFVNDIENTAKLSTEEQEPSLQKICIEIMSLTPFAKDNKKEIEDACHNILKNFISIIKNGEIHEDYEILRRNEIEGLKNKLLKILTDDTPHKS